MIKTKCFVSVFILFFFIMLTSSNTVVADDALAEISLPKNNRLSSRLIIQRKPILFMPTRLIIGQKNTFIIKGSPGAKVSLAISSYNKGSKPLMGNRLRLGVTEKTIDGIIPAAGIIELVYDLANDEELVDTLKYVELAHWTKEDYSDLTIAKLMSPSGKETYNNGLTISYPPSSGKNPSFSPVLPGMSYDIIKKIEHAKDAKEGKINPDLVDDGTLPAYLESPEKQDLLLHNLKNK